MSEPLYFAVKPVRAAKPVPVRHLAHQAACAVHAPSGSKLCEMGGVISGQVVDAIADWLRSDAATAVVLDALTLADPAVHRTPAASAAAVCRALAEHLGADK